MLMRDDQGQRCSASTAPYLDHQEVLIDYPVVREAAHRGDVLLGDIKLSAGIVGVTTLLAHPVHLLVHLCSVMEAHLTRASNCPRHTSWMPGTNAGNLQSHQAGHVVDMSMHV